MNEIHREDHEPPYVIEKLGWKYHHLGIPVKEAIPGEVYYPHLKIHVCGFSTSPFGIEWMRFDDDCPISELVKTVPHVAFEVKDIDRELHEHGFKILCPPGIPSEGVRAAMIEHNGAPVELIEFKIKNQRSKIKEQKLKSKK
ncbi:MAG TPA: hypothetical protein PK711_03730 [Bacteroidales bacterium]|nr:hypothetical protein [Bacteroidales bacterium]HRZ21071.1 hypothetical protein [Bacteroidales bacterium]